VIRVGLTGGIACGKSTVAAIFAELGAKVVDADAIVHQLYRPGEEVYQELVRHFGREIVRADGEIDRARLAAAAFDGGRVDELNKIVHPAVIRRQEQWMREASANDPNEIVIVEAALILEAGARERFDKIVVVTCKPEQKAARLAHRAGTSESQARAEVERRTRVQLSDEEKMRRADFVVDNSGPLAATRRQAEDIFARLKGLAQNRVE
jgi:dephospho-CoA kinase